MEVAVEYEPDVVMLDIGLPDMNGYEIARRLRQQPQTKDVRLLAVTGYGQDSDRQLSRDVGIDHHLVKPVEPQKLQGLLETSAKQPHSKKLDIECVESRMVQAGFWGLVAGSALPIGAALGYFARIPQ